MLKHMATIAATDQYSTPVIDFEEEEKKLHITDPFLRFTCDGAIYKITTTRTTALSYF